MSRQERKLPASHWGVGVAILENGRIVGVEGHKADPAASDTNANIPGSLYGKARVLRPAVRKSWLEGTPKAVERGRD